MHTGPAIPTCMHSIAPQKTCRFFTALMFRMTAIVVATRIPNAKLNMSAAMLIGILRRSIVIWELLRAAASSPCKGFKRQCFANSRINPDVLRQGCRFLRGLSLLPMHAGIQNPNLPL